MVSAAVEFRDVSKFFGETVAVDNISLRIAEGEFFSLLGPSGCGKTTTLRMIAGFESPSSGDILIKGQVMGASPPYRRPVNTVFQNYALFPHLTVAQNIAFGLQMRRVPKPEQARRVAEALQLVRLEGYEHRRPKQLSGGQQQRVALARALVNEPAVLLLDEPLGALDLKLRKDLQLELRALQERLGVTFVYVTHDQEEALTMSDRIAVMHQGKVLQVGTATEIYERPACRFVADFIGETNFLQGEVVETEGARTRVKVADGLIVVGIAPREVTPGGKVTIAIRPEKVHLRRQPPPDDLNVFPVEVSRVVYAGPDTRVHLSLAGGHPFVARAQNNGTAISGNGHYAPGEAAFLSWPAESAYVLAE
jgi:spermidine/putrescine transport system ATP-binding protein